MHLSEFVWTLRSSVWVVFNNFLLTDATDRSNISSNQKRFFIALSQYPISFFANTPFKPTQKRGGSTAIKKLNNLTPLIQYDPGSVTYLDINTRTWVKIFLVVNFILEFNIRIPRQYTSLILINKIKIFSSTDQIKYSKEPL